MGAGCVGMGSESGRTTTALAPPVVAGARDSTSEHAVHFYESEDTLVEAVREFLVNSLESNEPGIVIATAEHRQARTLLRAADLGADPLADPSACFHSLFCAISHCL